MHYSPKPEDLFTIILQISRFLKEFSDFETNSIPEFRHPYIKGKLADKVSREDGDTENTEKTSRGGTKQIIDIKSFLASHSKEAKAILDRIESLGGKHSSEYPFANEIQEVDDPIEKSPSQEENTALNYLEDIGLEKEIKELGIIQPEGDGQEVKKKIFKLHEQCKVEVPGGKAVFFKYFRDLIAKKKKRQKLYEEDLLEPCYYLDDENAQFKKMR